MVMGAVNAASASAGFGTYVLTITSDEFDSCHDKVNKK